MQTRECVCLAVMVSRTVGDGEIKPGKEQSPVGLLRVDPIGFTEVLEICVISDDCEWMVNSLQPMSPLILGPA